MKQLATALLALAVLASAPAHAVTLPLAADGASVTPPFPSPAPYFASSYGIKSLGGVPGLAYSDPFNLTNSAPTWRAVPLAPANLPLLTAIPWQNTQSVSAQTTPFSAWGSYLGNTSKPLPSTWGSFCAPTTGQSFPAMTGIVASSIGDTSGEAYTQCLVQWQTQYGNNHAESGLAINTLSKTGGGGAAQTGYNEKVGLYGPTVLAPGGSNTWFMNCDVTILAGVGKYPAFCQENDFTNFNGPYTNAADSLGVSATIFNTFLSSFPITAGELWSAGNQIGSPINITGRLVAGNAVITVTPANIASLSAGMEIYDASGSLPNSNITAINASNNQITVSPAPTTSQSSPTLTAILPGATSFFDATTTTASATITVNTGTLQGLYIGQPIKDSRGAIAPWTRVSSFSAANNTITLNSTPLKAVAHDTVFATPAGASDLILVNSENVAQDNTFYDGGNAQTSLNVAGSHQVGLSIGAGSQYAFALSGNPGCFFGLSACLSGSAAGLGSSSPIKAPAFIETLTTPASSSAACAAGQFTDDANYHYVCVSVNKWRRVALSDF